MNTIAVLLTCYNRKEKTLQCLKSLFEADLPSEYSVEVFLVDDGSTDGTGEAVEENFPQVKVIQGNGNLFWNQGMRLAWKTAVETKEYDFFLWLNDDTIIDNDAIIKLLRDDKDAKNKTGTAVLITAACRKEAGINEFSYGGRNDMGPVIPNGEIQFCTYINGNLVLVPQAIYKKIGMLSIHYTHALGDNDYGLRAIQNSYQCFTTKTYLATCPPNYGIPGWCNPRNSLRKRWKLLHSPLGLNIKEYNQYRKKFWGAKWMKFAFKAYLKTIIPKTYAKLSKS
ncbi:glycosyltransferase family 2 protein [Salegentibacter sp. JZCK2]|uniref:glycosyltransferase family 2 protein n=1 Tax=Salegentibacter tibetensis TaxID=2873600 RepID=UPI001CCDADC5|nr:glycosyltransferase family 2 protein [Salegentibacter tibetensis]MBZ9728694.1 glycosyltransferase family 2 protein [Salegentibacter tibetensis]